VGIAGATVAAFATFPLCFDLNTAMWFNDNFVTADVAEPEDLETWYACEGTESAISSKMLHVSC